MIEKDTLWARYNELVNHIKEMISRRIGFAVIEGFFLKYVSRLEQQALYENLHSA